MFGVIQLEDTIIKKVNYAVVTFYVDGVPKTQTIYGKSNLNKAINEIVNNYNLISSANIDVKVITERRAISFNDFIKYSEVL